MLIAFTFMSITASNASMSVACDMPNAHAESVYPDSNEDKLNDYPCHSTGSKATVNVENCCDSAQCICITIQQTTIQTDLKLLTSICLTEDLLVYIAHQPPEVYISSNYRPPIA